MWGVRTGGEMAEFSETEQVRREWSSIFKDLREKKILLT